MAEGKDLAVVGMVQPPECCKTAPDCVKSHDHPNTIGSLQVSRVARLIAVKADISPLLDL